jgi:hypothetical protein
VDELLELIGRGALSFVRQNAFWFALLVPILITSVLPITLPAQMLVVALIYLGEAIAYAIHRRRESS